MLSPHTIEGFLEYLTNAAPTQNDALVRAVALRAAFGVSGKECYTELQNALERYQIRPDVYSRVVEVIERARAVRENAHAPYSTFRVGAAVLCADGTVASGANVECSSYGLTLCAERAALAAARATGAAPILLVCIVADTVEPVSPCGACRQWIIELAPRSLVGMVNLEGQERWCTAESLLPFAFDSRMFHTNR